MGPHTVEHLFIHCTGRDCTGREMAQRRATLFARTEGTTNLGAIFTEFPREAVKFAFQTFGIPQFTRANWKIKAARKRGRHRAPAAAADDGEDGPPEEEEEEVLPAGPGAEELPPGPGPDGLPTSQMIHVPPGGSPPPLRRRR